MVSTTGAVRIRVDRSAYADVAVRGADGLSPQTEAADGNSCTRESLAPLRHFRYLTSGKEQPAKSIR